MSDDLTDIFGPGTLALDGVLLNEKEKGYIKPYGNELEEVGISDEMTFSDSGSWLDIFQDNLTLEEGFLLNGEHPHDTNSCESVDQLDDVSDYEILMSYLFSMITRR